MKMVNNLSLDWKQCQKDFEFDGSWRDIYILDTVSNDWNIFLESLLTSSYETKFWIDGKIVKPIKTIQEALKIRNSACPLMIINASGLHIACHFFTEEEIEFDIDPREVNDWQDLNKVIDFIIFVGNLLQKKVILTPENTSSAILINYNPETESLEHHNAEFMF